MKIVARASKKPQSTPNERPAPVADMTTDVALGLLADAVTELRADVERAEARAAAAEAATAALRVTVEDQTGLIRQLTTNFGKACVQIEHNAGRIKGVEERAEVMNDAIDACVTSADFNAAIERAETTVGEIAIDVADSARATAALVSTLTSKLPKSLIIDHAGDLVATLHDGEAMTIGPVRGPAGRDAPRIADVVISHGHLVHKMSDGTSFLAALPEPAPLPVPAPPLAARTPAGDRVKDEIRMGVLMDRKTDNFAAIGRKYGVSARVVSRIIKEFNA